MISVGIKLLVVFEKSEIEIVKSSSSAIPMQSSRRKNSKEMPSHCENQAVRGSF